MWLGNSPNYQMPFDVYHRTPHVGNGAWEEKKKVTRRSHKINKFGDVQQDGSPLLGTIYIGASTNYEIFP